MYELSDGQYKDEYGSFQQIGDQLVLVITGKYEYRDEDGKEYSVRYTSDEKGFREPFTQYWDRDSRTRAPTNSTAYDCYARWLKN